VKSGFGIEDADDLWDDLKQAIVAARRQLAQAA